jgi:hypothetical protein
MLAALPDWKMVVVGDVDTPETWSHAGIDFIPFQQSDRHSLPFRLSAELPSRTPARKMLGYLHAISGGAKVIYETDEENIPSELGWIRPAVGAFDLKTATVAGAANPYAYFGECRVWPRGFPLTKIFTSADGLDLCPNTAAQNVTMAMSTPVQQGISQLDPDAIWSLAHPERIGATRSMQDKPSLVLSKYSLSPYNSKNTVHHHRAFWALFIPPGLNARVCDIWRSYWAQRLLWEQHSHVMFIPTNGVGRSTSTNVSSYAKDSADFASEIQLYVQSHALIEFLLDWKCDHQNLFDCMLQLGYDMAVHNYWSAHDVDALRIWIEDLWDLGYAPPMPLRPLQTSTGRVAVILFGQERASVLTLPSLSHFMLKPYHADLYAVLLRPQPGDEDAIELTAAARSIMWYDEPNYNSSVCGRATNHSGNWVAPWEGRPGSGVYQLYNKGLIRDFISNNRLSHDWFVISRTDFLYVDTHFDFLDSEPACLIPDGQDWGGYNDRHLVCHRTYIIAALSQVDMVSNCSHPLWENMAPALNTEGFLYFWLTCAHIPVRRFPPTFFITATARTRTHWSRYQTDPAKHLNFKYQDEMDSALRNAGLSS